MKTNLRIAMVEKSGKKPTEQFGQIQRPDESWSLEQLGKYCQQKVKETAIIAWLVGEALTIVHDKKPHGGWGKWCLSIGFSQTTENKYRNLYKKTKLKAIEGMTLKDACSTYHVHMTDKTPAEVAAKRQQRPRHESDGGIEDDGIETDDEIPQQPPSKIVQNDLPILVDRLKTLLANAAESQPENVQTAITAVLESIEELQYRLAWAEAAKVIDVG